jgi:hypothetical protein
MHHLKLHVYVSDDSAKDLRTKQAGLTFLQQLIAVSSRSNNTSTTVNKLPPRLGVALDDSVDNSTMSGDNSTSSAPAVTSDPGSTDKLDLSDPEQQSQFLQQLMTPGASGSFATSNSYQQFGKAVNYAVSLSYSPLQSSQLAGKQDEEAGAKPPAVSSTTPKYFSGLRGQWSPVAPGSVNDVQSYYYPYYYYNHRPVQYYPTVH